jgi:Rieske Fe-S protein
MSDQPNAEPISGPAVASSRRTVLRAAGFLAAAGGAAVVTACAADGDPAAAPSTAAGSGSSSAPGSTSAASSAASSPTSETSGSPPKSAKAPSGPSVAASKVPVGGGVILNEADYVVTQPTKGKYKAFTKVCTHQGCAVAEVANGVIHCDCHGSEFSIKDGSVVRPPASRPLAEHDVTVSDGKVFVTG